MHDPNASRTNPPTRFNGRAFVATFGPERFIDRAVVLGWVVLRNASSGPQWLPPGYELFVMPFHFNGTIVGELVVCIPDHGDHDSQRHAAFGAVRIDDMTAWPAIEPGFPGNVQIEFCKPDP